MKKKIRIILTLLLVLVGCGKKIPDEEWQVSIKDVESVLIWDYHFTETELNKDDYTKLLEAYNNIQDIDYYELFNDGLPVFGRNMYTIVVNYDDHTIHLGLSDLGFLRVWDKTSNTSIYYNVDIFDEFNDVFRDLVIKYNVKMNDLRNFFEGYYNKIPYTNREDYIVDGDAYIDNFYKDLGISTSGIDKYTRVNEYLLDYISNPKCNDTIEIGRLTFKVVNVKDNEILSCYVRMK